VYDNWRLPHSAGIVAAYAERAGLEPSDVLAIIAREQHQTALVPVRLERHRLVPHARVGKADHRSVPLALAAFLMVALALATPSDPETERVASAAIAPRPAARVVPAAVTPAQDPVDRVEPSRKKASAPVSNRPAATRKHKVAKRPPRQQSAVVSNGAPAASRATWESEPPGDVVTAAETQSTPRQAFARLARAIAGDGRHRVEPFPRPAVAERPD
jgi:hypothetical protein